MFNWIKALLLSAARWADAEREKEREVCARWTEQTQRERERCVRALNRADAEREREVCVRAEQSRRRERERGVCARWTEQTQRERGVCALGEQDLALARQYRWFSETRFGCFFEGKKVAKGVCNVAKLSTLCISISPTTGWATGQTGNTRCVNRALKKLVPLKWICVNALTLTALIKS